MVLGRFQEVSAGVREVSDGVKKVSGGDEWVGELIHYKGVCGTALATLDLWKF